MAIQRKTGWVQRQSGFTLFEVLIAVAILGVIGVGFITALDTNKRGNRVTDEQVTAVNLITSRMEVIRQQTYADDYGFAVDNMTVPDQYDVDIEHKFSGDGEIWTDNSTGKTLQRIIISVSREGRPVFSMCTYKMKQ